MAGLLVRSQEGEVVPLVEIVAEVCRAAVEGMVLGKVTRVLFRDWAGPLVDPLVDPKWPVRAKTRQGTRQNGKKRQGFGVREVLYLCGFAQLRGNKGEELQSAFMAARDS